MTTLTLAQLDSRIDYLRGYLEGLQEGLRLLEWQKAHPLRHGISSPERDLNAVIEALSSVERGTKTVYDAQVQ